MNYQKNTGLKNLRKCLTNIYYNESGKCSTKPQYMLLLFIKRETVLQEKLQAHRATAYARNSVHQTWITNDLEMCQIAFGPMEGKQNLHNIHTVAKC
jgi:hypothetical protein